MAKKDNGINNVCSFLMYKTHTGTFLDNIDQSDKINHKVG